MKRNIKLITLALIWLSNSVSAQTVSTEDMSADASSTANIEISLNEVSNYVAMGFVITLPEGFTFTNKNNSAMANHEVRTHLLSKNRMKVAVYSLNNKAFNDVEEGMLSIQFKAGVGEGVYQGTISNIEFSTEVSRLKTVSDVTFNIAVSGSGAILGDANSDGKLTVADYTAITHYILGKAPTNFNDKAADVNGDSKINMADYTGVVHLLLYGTVEKPASK
jgi:hypothetical protein